MQAGVLLPAAVLGPHHPLALPTASPLTATQRHLASCLPSSARRRSFLCFSVLSLVLSLLARRLAIVAPIHAP